MVRGHDDTQRLLTIRLHLEKGRRHHKGRTGVLLHDIVHPGLTTKGTLLVIVGDRDGQRILVPAKDIAGLVCRQGSHRTLTGHHQRQRHSQCFCHPVGEKRRYCVTLTHT
ncbi:hypothetical protein C4A30_03945 [Escherichia coli]|nr:hypothetical protein C4A51_03977 [Escherichia coli]RDP85226.1 hypothetical protein C4A46_03954 [Escherichia coli]RDP97589.1 hypothetical protein C4A41_03952 [Escherichia coli]RDQ34434.1 hypothetical protein C4A32_03948 [Escherichia coli]RDQ45575.1 hypothetical protein C4A30_03945 [Escherichia coli]